MQKCYFMLRSKDTMNRAKMNRAKIIQKLIDKFNYKSYLEIGIFDAANFKRIRCHCRIGVDPSPLPSGRAHTDYVMFSDEFFKANKRKFDIVFIDGLHHADQVYRDIKNSLEVLNDNGVIVCHDMNPTSDKIQKVPRVSEIWTGDCWKAWVILRSEEENLDMSVVDIDWGCGIIRAGKQDLLTIDKELNWDNFSKNKKEWLNLISVDEFHEKFLN